MRENRLTSEWVCGMIITQFKRLLRLTENVVYHGGAGDLAGRARADRLGTRTVLGYVRLFS